MSNEWTTWTSLGKPGETDRFIALALGRHHDRSLAVFAGGPNNELVLRSETGDGSWSEWERIGDDTVRVNFLDLAVSRHANGCLAVFTLLTTSISPLRQELRHLAQTAPNGGWGTSQNLGAPQARGGVFQHDNARRRVVVGRNEDGRLEVFVPHWGNVDSVSRVADVWQVWQTAPNGDWSHWGMLGAIPKRSLLAAPFNLEVASNEDGRQELFVVGEHVGLWHIWQTAPNNGWSCWRDEQHLSWDRIAVGRNAAGCLDVFLTDGHGNVNHTVQTGPNGGWGDWLDLGNPEGVHLTTLAVESTSDRRLALFAKDGSDAGSFWHIRQTELDGSDWSTWEGLGRPEGAAEMPDNPAFSAFVVGRNQSDRLQLLASDRKGEVWTISQK